MGHAPQPWVSDLPFPRTPSTHSNGQFFPIFIFFFTQQNTERHGRSWREALRGRAAMASWDFRCAACRCARWLYHAAHITQICGTATSAGWLSGCGVRALRCSGSSICDLHPVALHVCGSPSARTLLHPRAFQLTCALAPPACPAGQLAQLVLHRWITLQLHTRLLSKWCACLVWLVLVCKCFNWFEIAPARGQRRAPLRFRPLLRLAPVTVGALGAALCLEMLEGRFLCILLGCIEIMYFLEDLVVCKFEITGRRVPRWEASRKCCVSRDGYSWDSC